MAPVRYRCAACGNLTRFDVVTDRRTRAFHHYSVGGDLVVEDEQVLAEDVVEISCRWCGHGLAVEKVEGVPLDVETVEGVPLDVETVEGVPVDAEEPLQPSDSIES